MINIATDIVEGKVVSIDIINSNSMYLLCIQELYYLNNEVVWGKMIFTIRQFWIWRLLKRIGVFK